MNIAEINTERQSSSTFVALINNDDLVPTLTQTVSASSGTVLGNDPTILADFSELEEALKKYLESIRSDKLAADFDPASCTWGDVLDELDRVKNESEDRQNKWHRKTRRTIANVGEDINPWLKMIPGENGLSVLSGGLTAILLAARLAERNRESILIAFGDIPVILEKASDKLTTFPSEIRLREHAKSLYATLLEELPPLIELLLHKRTKPKLLAPLRTQSSSNQIDERLDRIKRKVAALDDIANSLAQRTTVRTYDGIKMLDQKQDYSLALHQTTVSLQQQSLAKQEVDKQDILTAIEDHGATRSQHIFLEAIVNRKHMDEGFKADLLGALQQSEERRRRRHSPSFLTVDELRQLLCFSPLKAEKDLRYVLKTEVNFDMLSKGQAKYLLQRDEFNHWFWSANPELLIVNGHLTTSRRSKVSPLSLICGQFIDGLLNLPRESLGHPAILYFFCSENMTSSDSSGPQKLMRCLVVQLLGLLEDHGCLSLDFMDSRRWQRDLEIFDIECLCRVFWKLVNQLPMTSVYCFIDGLSLYERQEWKDDLLILVEELGEMIDDDKLRPRLKILITNPTRTRYLQHVVEDGCCISLSNSAVDRRPLSDSFLQFNV